MDPERWVKASEDVSVVGHVLLLLPTVSEQQEQLYTWAAVSQPPNSMEHFEGRLPAQVRGLWPSVRAGVGEPDRTKPQHTDSGKERERHHTHHLLSTLLRLFPLHESISFNNFSSIVSFLYLTVFRGMRR